MLRRIANDPNGFGIRQYIKKIGNLKDITDLPFIQEYI